MTTGIFPKLPSKSRKKLSIGLRDAFLNRQKRRFELIDQKFEGAGRNVHYVLAGGIDISKTNNAKRRVFVFDERYEPWRRSCNKTLSGGDSYPILTGMLSIGVSFAAGNVPGVIFTSITALADSGKRTSSVLVRPGDEVWHVEQFGWEGGTLRHMEYLVIWDPYRRNAQVASDWIIHEKRRDVKGLSALLPAASGRR